MLMDKFIKILSQTISLMLAMQTEADSQSNTAKNVAKQYTFFPEYKVLCLGQIQGNTLLSTAIHIFKHSVGCIMLWVCL